MKRFSIMLFIAAFHLLGFAARYEYTFHNTPVAKALAQLVRDNPEAKVTFIYNELDDYTTFATISTDNLKSAVKAIIGRNPISVSDKKGYILVEAHQKGKYRYSGTLLNEYKEPVEHATILLLNPKDSVVLTYGISGKDGSFLIPCDRSAVIAKISSTGYETKLIPLQANTAAKISFNTKAIQLRNVNITADNVRLEPDRTIFVPLQRQKNTAMNGIELIEFIGIPQVQLSPQGTLETMSGRPVATFIDFLPANAQELSAMNLQDVKRVEYLESPADPRFMGEKYVVNFIMEKYLYGGYVKLAGYETLNFNYQDFTGNIRYQYKNMTYDLAAFGQYDDFYHNGTETTEIYKFPCQDGPMETIERTSSTTRSHDRNATGRLSFKATYSSNNVTARSILSAGLKNSPVNDKDGEVVYNPEKYPDAAYSSESTNKSKFVQFNGSYFFTLPKKFYLTFSPRYTLSSTDQSSTYTQRPFQPILNEADDHTSNLSGFLNLNREFGKFGEVTAYISGQYDYFRTRYSGSAVNYDKTKDQRYKIGATYAVRAGGFYGEADFGWVFDHNRFNSYVSHTSTPRVEVSLAYLMRKKHRINLGFDYSYWAPDPAYKSEAVIEENHLMSYTGNPTLKPSANWNGSLSYTWLPSKNGYIQVFGDIWKVLDRYVYEYQPLGDRMIRYIRQPLGEYHLIRFGLSGRLYLLNRNLVINGSVYNVIARNGLPYDYTHSAVNYSLRATYWLNDFYFSSSFSCPSTYSDGFMVGDLYEDKSYYYLSAGWANKNWNIRFRAIDFARWDWMSHKMRFTSEYYDRSSLVFDQTRHANFNITVTYTLNYGKKQKDVDELNTSNSSSSGILRN